MKKKPWRSEGKGPYIAITEEKVRERIEILEKR